MTFLRHLLVLAFLSGSVSPSFAQQQSEAESFDLADYRGKIVYLDFWASWCTPCRASFPFMAELAGNYADELAIVAVNVDEQRSDALAFLEDFDTPFDVVFDPSGLLATAHQVPGMPTSFLFDREGQLLGKHVGFRKKDMKAIREWIAASIAN